MHLPLQSRLKALCGSIPTIYALDEKWENYFLITLSYLDACSDSARPEFLGVIDDPLFENLGVIGKFRGSELL